MTIIKHSQTNKLTPSSSTTIWEYLMDEPSISGAVSKINGHYPEKGFAVNKISKELVYILTGNGEIVTESDKTSFTPGDVIFIDKHELFAWQGNFSMFMVAAPKFDPKQHIIKDDS